MNGGRGHKHSDHHRWKKGRLGRSLDLVCLVRTLDAILRAVGAKLASDMIRSAFQSASLSWNLQNFKFMKYFRRPASHTMSTHIPTSKLEKYITDAVSPQCSLPNAIFSLVLLLVKGTWKGQE